MPLREHACGNQQCERYGQVEEHYFPRTDTPDPWCNSCGAKKKRLLSTFGIVFTGPLTAKYNDPKVENPHQEGHWAYSRKTVDGKPKAVWIDSFDAQREYCKQEGLTNPKDLGPVEVGSDGKSVSTRGLPGCW